MNLEILPVRTAGAAENMATDFLLLQRYPNKSVPRFRHYDWRTAAFTFGYGQKIAFVRTQLPVDETFDLCRRPTGGGIVDHRDDWTYALVIPRGHPLQEVPATASYRSVHEALADALRLLGVPVELKAADGDVEGSEQGRALQQESARGVCFERAEIHDVVHARSGMKIAGAAQKRNKHGLLFQGSVSRLAISDEGFDWNQFEAEFSGRVAAMLGGEPTNVPWPDFHEDEISALTEQYSSPEWLEYR